MDGPIFGRHYSLQKTSSSEVKITLLAELLLPTFFNTERDISCGNFLLLLLGKAVFLFAYIFLPETIGDDDWFLERQGNNNIITLR